MNFEELFGPKIARNNKNTKLSKTLDDLLGFGPEPTEKATPKPNEEENDSRRSSLARAARRNSTNSEEGRQNAKELTAPLPSDRTDKTFSRPTTRHGRRDSNSERHDDDDKQESSKEGKDGMGT
uniref:Uncharacterized protein n=1 Tax=Plectus sambesii TaxID=2011161 RepID=A0A914V2P2_9BILA